MMDVIEVDKTFYDIGEGDLKDLWGSDSFDSTMPDMETDWTNLLDNHQPIILHDRMMSDAVQSPRIQSEHSYSLAVGDDMPDSPLSLNPNIKLEDYSKDMESECFPTMPMSSTTNSDGGQGHPHSDFSGIVIKQEPLSPPPTSGHLSSSSSSSSSNSSSPLHQIGQSRTLSVSSLLQSSAFSSSSLTMSSNCNQSSALTSALSAHPQSLLKPPTILLATRPLSGGGTEGSNSSLFTSTTNGDRRLVYPKVNIKLEPMMSSSGFSLPPTPPSSTGSDSEGSLSPVHGTIHHQHPSSPPSLMLSGHHNGTTSKRNKIVFSSSGSASNGGGVVLGRSNGNSSASSSTNCSPLISSQPKGATGTLMLTEEEKRTLLAEGYPIPQRLPLTKAEERSLKKIRRKIKNKISAQESRRKKKEYMDALEKKVEMLTTENSDYKRRCDSLEGDKKSLINEVQKLQAIVCDMPDNKYVRSLATQTLTSCQVEFRIEDENKRFVQPDEMMDLVDSHIR